MFWLLIVTLGLVVLFGIRKYTKRNQSYWEARSVPFFDNTKFYSSWTRFSLKYNVDEIAQHIYKGAKSAGTKYAGLVELGNPLLYIMDPNLIKTILIQDFDSFVDRRLPTTDKDDPLYSNMLSNIKGQAWKDLRSTMSPTFSTGKIRRMFSVFSDSSTKLIDYLRREIQITNEIDLRDAFGRYTMDVVASTAFGLDSQSFSATESDFAKYAKRFQNQFSGFGTFKFLLAVISPKLLSILGISLTDKEATNFFSQVIKDAIKHRDVTGEKRQDFLQLMMEARNSNFSGDSGPVLSDEFSTFDKDAQIKGPLSKVQLTEDLILSISAEFFLGGFDTVETFLLMAAYELALNPDAQEKLYQELSETSEANNGELTYDLVMKLDYLEQVASETLRKWPPGVHFYRKSTKEYKIPNTNVVIDKDTVVAFPAFGIHRDERYYPDPEEFQPERFTTENRAKRNPYTYLPFGAGPRSCIAMRFGLAEGKAAIAHLILNFKFEPSAKTEIPLKLKASRSSFKPTNGVWLRLTPRS